MNYYHHQYVNNVYTNFETYRLNNNRFMRINVISKFISMLYAAGIEGMLQGGIASKWMARIRESEPLCLEVFNFIVPTV